MATSNIKALIPGELHTVWDFVLDIENSSNILKMDTRRPLP